MSEVTLIPSPSSQALHTPSNPSNPTPTHLILLTCHSIYVSGDPTYPTSWLLAPFQKAGNEHLTFLNHITLASSLLSSDPNALLVISGGSTRKEVCKSEARGYFEVGKERGLWSEEGFEGRIILEEKALDSYGNLLRGLIAFGGGWEMAWEGDGG
ncbi:4869449d-9f57-4ceb-a6d5-d242b3d9eb08 [Sclerotinia trifoliorum]|uniref:4869449d-9f57-4ceb-a6d5-d242b3d9eb08 n=1 Tax=Sclerotinia trifoliorum TaxID=28548 RepID=A0A8H2VV06_9HELO|nr:4869449d-9f57-4ceb-a6d5-d242b3d9eb08 [Sclerotinia trifoliorum]